MSLVDLGNLNSNDDNIGHSVFVAVVSLMIGLTLVLALRASGVAWRFSEAFLGIAVALGIAVLIIDHTTDADVSALGSDRPSLIWVAVAIVTPFAVIRRLVYHRRVSVGTRLGAVAAYLLIALAYCYLFLYIDSFENEFFTEGSQPTTSFMYFSLVSVTTVGYGNLTPGTPPGRLLASSEAVIGQIYLVTFVAMLVGLLIQQGDGSDPSDPGPLP